MERRRAHRRHPQSDEPIGRMRLRTGRELQVLDLADVGALVDGDVRLLPGTRVDVHVVTKEGRVLVRSRVVRAFVAHLTAQAIRYRIALAFDDAVETAAGYQLPKDPGTRSGSPGSVYPAAPVQR